MTLYATAFEAAQRGDSAAADQALAQVSDPCLAGKVEYLEFTHGGARTASYDQLTAWLKSFGDMPGAGDVYQMALRRRPADALPPAPVSLSLATAGEDEGFRASPSPQSRAAREAYFSGQVDRALELARESGDAWIAGLSAYRLGDYANAMVSFESLAANPSNEDWLRAAGGFWGARSAVAAGMGDRATPLLKIAAAAPGTFYGMIATRKLQLQDDPMGRLMDAAVSGAPGLTPTAGNAAARETALDILIRTDPRARRAVALMQLERPDDARAEVGAAMAAAPDDAARELWMGLMFELNPAHQGQEIVLHASAPVDGTAPHVYPTPTLQPTGGYTIDKALVYAITWQESRFNGLAVSRVGAVGLMQMMPRSAAYISGDQTLAYNPIPLYDTGKNLALGQNYVTWLEQNASDHDLLRTVAAYNAGPGALARTENLIGANADSLMVIESMPAAETRDYVKKVVTAYWSYRRQFGVATRTLDAVASDASLIDQRLDAPTPVPPPTTPANALSPVQNAQAASPAAREAMDILLGSNG
jgi:soluble lytic murein transglycosylase-like protein